MNIGIKRELEFASILKKQDIAYIHHPPYVTIYGERYHADFYLSQTDEYIEIIGSRQGFHSRKEKIQKAMEFLKIKLLNPDGSPYNFHQSIIIPKRLKSLNPKEHGLKTCICGIRWLPNNDKDSELCGRCKRKELQKESTLQTKLDPQVTEKIRESLKYLRNKYGISFLQWQKELLEMKYKISESTIRRFVDCGFSISESKKLMLLELIKKVKQKIPNISCEYFKTSIKQS